MAVCIGGQSGCRACDAGKGCGAGLFGKLLRRRPVELEMANENGSSVGQVVRLGIAESLFMRMVLRLYGLPLLTGLAGAVAGYGLATSLGAAGFLADVVTLIAACISVGGVLIFLKTTTTQHVSSMDIHVLESTSSNADCAYGENEDPVNS